MDFYLQIMQNFILAILTLLIPFAMVVLNDLLNKKRDDKEFSDLDFYVILEKIFNIPVILIYVVLFFLMIILFSYFSNELKSYCLFPSFIIFLLLLSYEILNITYNFYLWFKGGSKIDSFRIDYLSKNKNVEQKISSWNSVWSNNKINYKKEELFFKVFLRDLYKYMEIKDKKQEDLVVGLLNSFYNNFENRGYQFSLIEGEVYLEFFKFHFEIWNRKFNNKVIKNGWHYGRSINILNKLITKYYKTCFDKGDSFSFFDVFKNYVNDCKNREYIVYLFEMLIREGFLGDIANSEQSYHIWKTDFPKEWKITETNFKDPTNFISKIFFREFFSIYQHKITSDSDDFDKELDSIVTNLFPEVDPTLWADILIYVLCPHVPKKKMESVINFKKSFGFIGRIHTGWGDGGVITSDLIREENVTLDLALILFRSSFDLYHVGENLKELERLESKYSEDGRGEDRRTKYLEILNSIKDRLKPKKVKKNKSSKDKK